MTGKLNQDAFQDQAQTAIKVLDRIKNHLENSFDPERGNSTASYWDGYNQALKEIHELIPE